MHLNIFVSQSCFVHCKGCYSYSREEENDKQISTDKLVSFLKFIYNKGVQRVTLCGGDPLTRKDIIELLAGVKMIGFNISLDTLGSTIIKNAESDKHKIIKQIDARKIAELVDIIGIPIDGSTNEIFKRFRQIKADIVNEQIAVCEKLHKYGAHICINTVVHKGNLEDACDLAKLIKKMDYIDKWQMFQYMPLGKFGYKNRRYFEITEEQFTNFKSEVITIFEKDINKLQFKDSNNRRDKYMLVDNSGNAWIPSMENMSLNNCSYIINDKTIIGNINNSNDWDKICSYLDKNVNNENNFYHSV